MKKWERRAAIGLFLIAVGAAVKAVEIGYGSFKAPGPGFFPFWLAVLMALVAALYFLTNWGPDSRPEPLWSKGILRRPAAAVAVMLVYIQALDFLGFGAATLCLFATWLRAVEEKSWRMVGLVAVIGTVAVYVVFVILLQLPMPRGLLV
jgi:putative tricarboxylic transport membrane protein